MRERERLRHELSVARNIQQAPCPANSRASDISRSAASTCPDPDHLAFLIVDVSGKGLGAALVTALLQGTFSTISLEQPRAAVFAHVNRFICAHSEVNRYVTLYFGLLEAAGHVEFINAGHPAPLIIRNSSVQEAEPGECLPVGLFPEAQFKTSHTMLRPGDTLVLFTDGVTDPVAPDGERFGLERLKEVVALHAAKGSEELQAAIVDSLKDFAARADHADDVTSLIIRYASQ